MAKITVQVAAKRLGMEPMACLKRLQEMGIMVRDQLDKVDTDVFEQVKAHLDEEKLREKSAASATSKRIGNKIIRRRRVKKDKPEETAAEETAEAPEEEPAATAAEPTPEAETAPTQPEQVPEEPAVVEAEEEIVTEEAVATEPEAPVAADPAPGVVAEDDTAAEQTEQAVESKEDAEDKGVRRVEIKEVTKEPAKILSKPKIPIEPIKQAGRGAATDRFGKPEDRRPAEDDSGRRKGRRVVDFGQRGRRKDEQREMGFLRNRRGKKKKSTKQTEITTPKAIKRKIKVGDQITVGDLAKRMGVKAGDLIKNLLGLGMMVTINQQIDLETATILATDFGFEVERSQVEEQDLLQVAEANPENMQARPPVVTVMGHVDHGKTTLLDAIRETNVADGEAGGITQHIGAYSVSLSDDRQITFVDTPGHESFANMRARGAQVTDIVILVVAADDGVMPQTIESINHAKEAEVPLVVAINKIDKDNADREKITRQLMEHGLLPENLGGDTLFVPISAKKRQGIEELLESVLLQAEMLELTADPDKEAIGIVVDARLERGRGPVADVLVREGTLRQSDFIVADTFSGRVRMMFDDKGNQLDRVTPGMPAEVIGLNGVPQAGMIINAVRDEKKAKAVAQLREQKARAEEQKKRASIRLEDLYAKAQEGETQELKVVIKCDVHGSLEAVRDSLLKLGNEEIKVKVIHGGVGTITETDVNLAAASEAIIIGFNIRPEAKAKESADAQSVEIRLYTVIYDLIQEIKAAMEGMLAPTFHEVINGVAEVRNTFHISRVGTVAGCYVLEGKILRNSKVRLVRDGAVVHTGSLGTLRRFKDDAKEVQSGFECGINIEGYNDVKLGDRIESFSLVEERPTL